eukprot:NP_001076529.1 uncharacterized protein LOC100034459 [Danio rerio]
MAEERVKDSLSEKHSVRSGSCVSSSVSLKSDRSKGGHPPNFSEKTPSSVKRFFHLVKSKHPPSNLREKTPSSAERYFVFYILVTSWNLQGSHHLI